MLTKKIVNALKDKFLLIDTNFLLDSLRFPETFYGYYQEFKDNQIELVTIDLVTLEVYKGSDTTNHIKDKEEFLKILSILPIDTKVKEDTFEMTLAFRKDSKDLAITDLHLAGMLKRYKGMIFLLTRNHKDFPLRLFDRKGIIPIGLENAVNAYSIISYSEEKFTKAMTNLRKAK